MVQTIVIVRTKDFVKVVLHLFVGSIVANISKEQAESASMPMSRITLITKVTLEILSIRRFILYVS